MERTQEHRQHDQPRPNVREGLINLLAFETSVLRPNLVIANAFQCRNALLPSEHLGVHWGIRHPQQNRNAHRNGECAEEEVEDAVWLE